MVAPATVMGGPCWPAVMGRLASAVLLAASLAIAPAWADDEEDLSPSYAPPVADDAVLATHGTWLHHAAWGRVWRPHVAVGWRPYTRGYWAWSPYGWTWVSSEPWGWAFHYGRWGWWGSHGWVWVPGTVWAPAWVDWWEADGWIGWAPLGPPGWIGVRDRYVFVRDHDFCDRHLHHHLHDHRHVHAFGRHGWAGRRSGPPARHRIERVSRHAVVHVPNPRRGDTLGTRRLPAPTRPGGTHAVRGRTRDVRPAPVLPRGFHGGGRHESRIRVPRVPDRVVPHRPGGPSDAIGSGRRAAPRPQRWQRPPGRADFGGGRGAVGVPTFRHHLRGETGGGRGRIAPPSAQGGRPSPGTGGRGGARGGHGMGGGRGTSGAPGWGGGRSR